MWFKADPGKSGVLFSEQNKPIGDAATHWVPALYVDITGKLRGYFWTSAGNPAANLMASPGRVDDGQWHHVALSAAVDTQVLYLDAQQIGTVTGKPILHRDTRYTTIGNGKVNSDWTGTTGPLFAFTGTIDDAAVYRYPLSPIQVAAHYAARASTSRLTVVTELGGFVATRLSYDGGTGRITTLADRNGATWTVGGPALGDKTRSVTLASTTRSPVTYTYDTEHSGRLTSRQDTFGTRTWEYNAAGFNDKYVDENGRMRFFYTDARGNVTDTLFHCLSSARQPAQVWSGTGSCR
jgi:hypothetical protein